MTSPSPDGRPIWSAYGGATFFVLTKNRVVCRLTFPPHSEAADTSACEQDTRMVTPGRHSDCISTQVARTGAAIPIAIDVTSGNKDTRVPTPRGHRNSVASIIRCRLTVVIVTGAYSATVRTEHAGVTTSSSDLNSVTAAILDQLARKVRPIAFDIARRIQDAGMIAAGRNAHGISCPVVNRLPIQILPITSDVAVCYLDACVQIARGDRYRVAPQIRGRLAITIITVAINGPQHQQYARMVRTGGHAAGLTKLVIFGLPILIQTITNHILDVQKNASVCPP
jgi:hypothetical protein